MDQSDPIIRTLLEGVHTQVFPGGVLLVRHCGRTLLHQGVGLTSYHPTSPAIKPETIFDLASLTKPIATASAILLLVQDGLLDLDQAIDTVLEKTKGLHLGQVSLRKLLCHQAGLPAWRAFYQSFPPPLSSEPLSRQERIQAFLELILKEPITHLAEPKSVYSDLGYMVLGFVVEQVTNLSLAEFCRKSLFSPLQASLLGYGMNDVHGEKVIPFTEIPPTEEDPWRGRLLQGEVHDENAAALGGIAGHAGLFGNAEAVGRITNAWLEGYYGVSGLLENRLVQQFVMAQPGSSWGLGWDTPSEPSSSGQWFSPHSFGHLGFTGTSIWIDPDRKLEVIFLSNRVHPTRENQGIKAFRPRLHDVIIQQISTLS